MRNLVILCLFLWSCNDHEAAEREQLLKQRESVKERMHKDSLKFERVERLMETGMSYEDAKRTVDNEAE